MKAQFATIFVWVAAFSCYHGPAFAQLQSPEQQLCIDAMIRDGASVARQQGKENSRCVKEAGKGKLELAAQACLVADEKGSLEKRQQKTLEHESKKCGTPPDFAYVGASDANSNAQLGELNLSADLFGSDLDIAILECADNAAGCKCQAMVSKAVHKLADVKMNEFVKCQANALKEGKNPIVEGATSSTDLEGCVDDDGMKGSIAADTKDRIEKKRAKLGALIEKKCDASEVTDGAFPGVCDGMAGTALRDCLDQSIDCRVCQMTNDMAALSADCDQFDDGLVNDSCDDSVLPAPQSCQEILERGDAVGDGIYEVVSGQVYCDMTVDGGGWTLVRRVEAGPWHPATDTLAGTDSYGTYVASPTAASTFSMAFDSIPFTELGFSTGDGFAWATFTAADVYLLNFDQAVNTQVQFSINTAVPAGGFTNILNRTGLCEDPWIGAEGTHTENIPRMLYGECGFDWASHTAFMAAHLGANVWIR